MFILSPFHQQVQWLDLTLNDVGEMTSNVAAKTTMTDQSAPLRPAKCSARKGQRPSKAIAILDSDVTSRYLSGYAVRPTV